MSVDLPSIPVRGAMPCLERGCSACCHDIEMLLTDADVARIGAVAPGVDFWFMAEDGHRQLRTRDGPAAKGGAGKPCVFLSPQGTCSIHAARPEGCRLYPAVWDDDAATARLDADYCPHTDGFLLPPATQDATRRLVARLHAQQEARARAGGGTGAGRDGLSAAP
ncbi:MAG TPA: YkgJ family cysteine cluster protein [Candidatus Thermoplasmatota archaeon]|nr:YkgJ family cysteine cluster protein [Candidatus Thermoplasmatota archaeon]